MTDYIKSDIKKAYDWCNASKVIDLPGEGEGWRHTCLRLAKEVERLQKIADKNAANKGIKKTIYLYRLTDAQNNQTVTVVDLLSDDFTINGYDKNGQLRHFFSFGGQELPFADTWAKMHGMKFESATLDIDIYDNLFKKDKQ